MSSEVINGVTPVEIGESSIVGEASSWEAADPLSDIAWRLLTQAVEEILSPKGYGLLYFPETRELRFVKDKVKTAKIIENLKQQKAAIEARIAAVEG